jgi:hypothetical protein
MAQLCRTSTNDTDFHATVTDALDARVAAICAQVAALDTEIATVERAVAPLPDVLADLTRHPILWLLIGREGIDRPGGWGTIVGQQVVTVVRRDWRAMVLVGLVMLLLGVGLGIGGWVLLTGGLR